MEKLIETLQSSLGASIPGVVGALVLLIIGWAVAIAIKLVLKKTLSVCKINSLLQTKGGKSNIDFEKGIASAGYYVALLFVLLTVFNQLGLETASQPIQGLFSHLLSFIPSLISGGILLLVAWLCATLLKKVITGILSASKLDEKIKMENKSFSQVLGDISFWLVILIFLPGILGIFNLEGLMDPAESMVNQIMGMVPHIFGAVVIIFVGWFIAKILKDVITNILAMAGADKFGEKVGLSESIKISGVIGLLVYIFVLVPAIIAGLNALKIESISGPATEMLSSFISAIPDIISAVAIVLVTFLIAKPIAGFVASISASAGIDTIPEKLGLKIKFKKTPSEIFGNLVFFFLILFACVEAANRLQMQQFSKLVAMFIEFGGQILLGSIIITIGLWLANLISGAIKSASGQKSITAGLVRIVILGLVFAMGLRAMGIADDIVNMAFGLTLGAAAVAFALAFGIGGREAAGKQLEYWFSKLRDEKN